ncbi:Hypothetical protein FKW44_010897 [Caligus rogercresseyi]|uniref:Uncharacterized protein n=1 Tax=Caligus rogercresseyi TaxID=217165 RepID=A0A7T8K8H0_CALRO|nr:Hypothetical protein FKW44_010897 [Caligus rogercresseyi]
MFEALHTHHPTWQATMSFMTRQNVSEHYNRDIGKAFPAQLVSFRTCFREKSAKESSS